MTCLFCCKVSQKYFHSLMFQNPVVHKVSRFPTFFFKVWSFSHHRGTSQQKQSNICSFKWSRRRFSICQSPHHLQEEKGTTEAEMVGWHHRLNGHEFGRWWRTGKPGMLQSMRSQRVRHDWATELIRNADRYPPTDITKSINNINSQNQKLPQCQTMERISCGIITKKWEETL